MPSSNKGFCVNTRSKLKRARSSVRNVPEVISSLTARPAAGLIKKTILIIIVRLLSIVPLHKPVTTEAVAQHHVGQLRVVA